MPETRVHCASVGGAVRGYFPSTAPPGRGSDFTPIQQITAHLRSHFTLRPHGALTRGPAASSLLSSPASPAFGFLRTHQPCSHPRACALARSLLQCSSYQKAAGALGPLACHLSRKGTRAVGKAPSHLPFCSSRYPAVLFFMTRLTT